MTTTQNEIRPNRYGGRCHTCGSYVEAGAGTITKTDQGWRAVHLDGQCPTPAPVGIYRHDGHIYLVKESRGQKDIPAGQRRRYAERLAELERGMRATEGGGKAKYRFEYAPRVIWDLTEDERVPIDDDEVTAMMIATGQCIYCRHPLYAEETIRKARDTGVMVGPVCRKRFAPPSRGV